MKHPHAELMMQYAQDAMETDKPWERWQYRLRGGVKKDFDRVHPTWRIKYEYFRKPQTITINGFEVPEPVREPLIYGTRYYVANLGMDNYCYGFTWTGDHFDNKCLNRGIIHLTKEAAELHATALLSFTQLNEEEEK